LQEGVIVGGFKRFLLVVFALAGGIALAALLLPWLGPWTRQATALLAIDWYDYVIEVCCLILGIGLVVSLLRGIFSRRADSIVVTSVDGGEVTVSRDAIASQAVHIIEEDGSCLADDVRVSAKRSGKVRVSVRVLPHQTVDVTTKGPQLHQALMEGLAALCADKLKSVDLEFIEPQTPTDPHEDQSDMVAAPADEDHEPMADYVEEPQQEPSPSASSKLDLDRLESFAAGGAPSPDDSGDITVPLRDERSE
jgi:hypothetical protein